MKDDIILNKATTIERYIKRITQEYVGYEDQLENNFTKQDAIILNIQRACEAAIDLAIHVIKLKHLGVPQGSRDTFVMLEKADVITPELSKSLQAMVGFRNIAVHDYTRLNLAIIHNIIKQHLQDISSFSNTIIQQAK